MGEYIYPLQSNINYSIRKIQSRLKKKLGLKVIASIEKSTLFYINFNIKLDIDKSVVIVSFESVNQDENTIISIVTDWLSTEVEEEDETEYCPNCGSKRIFNYTLDSDWSYGSGSYTQINEDKCYPEEEQNLDGSDRPDIDFNHCRCCDHTWFD